MLNKVTHLSNVQRKRRISKLAATKSEGQRQRILGGPAGAAASSISALAMEHGCFPDACVHTEGFRPLKARLKRHPHRVLTHSFTGCPLKVYSAINCSPPQQSGRPLPSRRHSTVLCSSWPASTPLPLRFFGLCNPNASEIDHTWDFK